MILNGSRPPAQYLHKARPFFLKALRDLEAVALALTDATSEEVVLVILNGLGYSRQDVHVNHNIIHYTCTPVI